MEDKSLGIAQWDKEIKMQYNNKDRLSINTIIGYMPKKLRIELKALQTKLDHRLPLKIVDRNILVLSQA